MELRNLGSAFLGKWQHVAYVYDDVISGTKMYINSAQKPLVPWPGGNLTDVKDLPSTPLTIGQASIGPAAASNARIANVRIYDRHLNAQEIQTLYFAEGFSADQKNFLNDTPSVMGHYSQADYTANRTNGQSDVTTNPSAFSLFTQSEYEGFGGLQFSNGVSSVLSNPSLFNLFTQEDFEGNRSAGQSDVINNPMSYGLYTSDSIMDLRMGGLMIQRIGTNAVVSFQPQTTTDLNLPFTNNGTPIISTIPMPGNKGFIRINAKP